MKALYKGKRVTVKDIVTVKNQYINNHKKLNKKLSSFGQNTQTEIQKAMEKAKQAAKEELKQEIWLENNPDFFDSYRTYLDEECCNKWSRNAPYTQCGNSSVHLLTESIRTIFFSGTHCLSLEQSSCQHGGLRSPSDP